MRLSSLLELSFATANNLVAQFQHAGLLTEITGGRRRRVIRFDSYLALLRDEPSGSDATRSDGTEKT